MVSFISKVVKDVISKHQNVSEITFILPSQRSCVFLKEEIKLNTTAAHIMPKIISIENFIQALADVSLIEKTQLIFEFYTVYKNKLPSKNVDSFETFSQWASTALNDFNEIDSYLIDANQLFSNLKDIKRLNEWLNTNQPSELAINYFQFFEHLNTLYKNLYKNLKNNKVGYQGLIYREATKNLEYFIANNSNAKFIFVGFNALNKAEEYIFQELLNNNLATIYWDVSNAMFENNNESGFFIRKYKNQWPFYKKNAFNWIEEVQTKKEIKIIGIPKNTTQIKYTGELLSNLTTHQNTAVVLSDENLLPLALNSLPNNVEHINITMGYPLKNIPIANLFDKLFKLHLNQQKFSNTNTTLFYFKDVLKLLNDPFLNQLHQTELQQLITKIKLENNIFLSLNYIKNQCTEAEIKKLTHVFSLFQLPSNINSVIEKCIALINEIKVLVSGVDKEYLFRFYNVFKQLETLNKNYNYITNLKTLSIFYYQLLQTETLSFRGEPLKGLQLMGMLETRVLDFDTIILTSVNEGILPGGKGQTSFIPFDVKKHYGLPTYQEKDAIFSYHFERLLQRAKQVYLLYNTENDGYGAGEKSRFLTKIEINNPDAESILVSPMVQHQKKEAIQIAKTPEVIQKIKAFFESGISPSAIASYIYNPLKFYEQKILKIENDIDIEETIAVNTMGTVIHEVLETLYKPYINTVIMITDIKEMFSKIDNLLTINFEHFYKKGSINTGKNKLIVEVCRNHIVRFLKQEIEILKKGKQLKILALESKFETYITVPTINFPVKIKGVVDRIDELDGVIRIIDYKTGKVELKDLKVTDFNVLKTNYNYSKALQVLLYSLLFSKSNMYTTVMPIEAGIISFKNLNAGFLKINFSEKRGVADNYIKQENLAQFLVVLNEIISEIINPDIPFIEIENTPF